MKDLSLAEWLGVGGFFISLLSLSLSLFFESRRIKGNIRVSIKSIKKMTGNANRVVVYQVEIVNASLEKRYIKSIYQHNTRGRFGLFFLKNEKRKSHIKRWQLKEEFTKHIPVERGESIVLKYELIIHPESINRNMYFKFLVNDSLGKKYESAGIYLIPNQLPDAHLKPGVMYL